MSSSSNTPLESDSLGHVPRQRLPDCAGALAPDRETTFGVTSGQTQRGPNNNTAAMQQQPSEVLEAADDSKMHHQQRESPKNRVSRAEADKQPWR